MKIGIITFSDTQTNYGQVLQLYATQQLLIQMGHEPFLIDYSNATDRKGDNWLRIKNIFSYTAWLKKFNHYFPSKEMQKRESREFDSFREKEIRIDPTHYPSIKELKKNPPKADVYICGSDQVWCNAILLSKKTTQAYFLDFGKPETRRIALSPSFGTSNLSPALLKQITPYIQQMDSIFPRENKGFDICKKIGASSLYHSLDPTLLLDFTLWNKLITKKENSTKKGFVYLLDWKTKIKTQEIQTFLQKEKCEMHYTCNKNFIDPLENCYPTIKEWIQYIYNASIVITNSFHGLVFCILFNKDFILLPLIGNFSQMNDRMYSLLEELHIEGHICTSTLEQTDRAPIDWETVNKLLADKRKTILQQLKQALS